MDKHIESKLNNVLKSEGQYIMKNEKNIMNKLKKMDIIFNMQKIVDNYDELEPILKDYFRKKAEKEKYKERS